MTWSERQALEAITEEFEKHVRELDNRESGRKGMQVTFTGDFISALQLPSFNSRLRWWAKQLREALDGKPDDKDHSDCFLPQTKVFICHPDCAGDGHYLCRKCLRFIDENK